VGTVIHSQPQRNDDRHQRWERIKRAELFERCLLLDSRVAAAPKSYPPLFVTLSFVKLFFFNGPRNACGFSDQMEA